jgi:hypothetical protein
LQDFVVPEPDNAKTLALKPIGATLVVNSLPSFSMLPTIEFDDEAWAKAREIDDVIANQGLVTEAETSELFISQPLPKRFFRIGRLKTQLTGPANWCGHHTCPR